MPFIYWLKFLGAGFASGIVSGFFGVGGAIVLIPILVFLFKFPQQTAAGTSLVALLLPVGLLGVMEYYRAGKIDAQNIRMGLLIAIGIFFGAFFGARFSLSLPETAVRIAFAGLLVFAAFRMVFL